MVRRDDVLETAFIVAIGFLVAAMFVVWSPMPGHTQDAYGYFRNYDFSGGLNSATSPFLLQDNEAADITNLFITTEGAVESRGGFVHHSNGPAGTRCSALFRYYQDAQSDGEWVGQFLPAQGTTGESYFMEFETGGDWSILFVETADDHFHEKDAIVNFLGRLYVTNSADGLRWYQHPATTGEVSTAPDCSYLTVHGQRLYMAGDPLNPFTFYFSGLRNGTVWDDVTLAGANAGYWKLPSSTGGAITGLANWKGYLLIFTESSIWALQGDYPDEASISEIVAGIGCTAPHSIVEIGGEVLFKSGARIYKMGVPPVDISKKVYGSLYNSDAANAVGWNRNYVITNPPQDHTYELSSTLNVYLYDIDYDRWTKFNNIPYHTGAVSSASRDSEQLLVARSDSEEIGLYSSLVNYDVWGNYDTVWKSRIFHLGTPELNKKFRHMQLDVYGSTADILCTWDLDYARVSGQAQLTATTNGGLLDYFVLDTDTIGGASDAVLKFSFNNVDMGKTIQFTFSTSESAEYFKIYGYVLRYRQKPFRGSSK